MRELAAASWELYRDAVDHGTAVPVRPSIPILFFGDEEKYISSPLKVITVGLNPSRLEFPGVDPFLRFPAARQIDPQQPALDAHLEALRAYFRVRPYSAWFRPAFEPILNGLAASYYEGTATSTALHTDISGDRPDVESAWKGRCGLGDRRGRAVAPPHRAARSRRDLDLSCPPTSGQDPLLQARRVGDGSHHRTKESVYGPGTQIGGRAAEADTARLRPRREPAVRDGLGPRQAHALHA